MAAPAPVAAPNVVGRPFKWRILGVLTGPTADAIVEGDQRGLGAIEEIFELPGTEAEVHVIKYPRLEDLSTQLQGWKPNFVYVYGGANGDKKDLEKQSVSHLNFLVDNQGRFVEAALHLFLASFGGLHLDTVYFDAQGCTQIGEALHAAGVPNVVVWPRNTPPPCLPAMQFAHAFFCMLRNRSVTVPEAFALASHMCKAQCSQPPPAGVEAGPLLVEPILPGLLTRANIALPSIASVPPLLMAGRDMGAGPGGIPAAIPGYEAVRLLAPNAELRLLACGLSGFINPQSLAYLGESLRALVTLEVRRLAVQRLAPLEKVPEHLPPGSAAVRCELLSHSGAPMTVVLGGPVDVLQNPAVVEHALRQTMVADAYSLQFKLPPPSVPLPASRTNPAVAAGAPVVEALMATSTWVVQLLKSLCQDPGFRGLVAMGLGAVSNSPVAAFTRADANRYTVVITNNVPSKLLPPSEQEGGAAGEPSAPGPASTTEASEVPLPSAGTAGTAAAAAVAAAAAAAAAAGGLGALPPAGMPSGMPAAAMMAALARSGSFAGQPGTSSAAAGGTSQLPAGSGLDPHRLRSESPEHSSAADIINPALIQRGMQVAPWRSNRPPIKQCSEEQFMSDLIAFLTDRQGRQIDPKSFPEAILNGSRLDLYNLYREVCNRGGYQVGNGINWKGQVFPRMRNYTAQHKMTGVGNALKRHYQMFLLEYENAHPEDVNGGQCALCGRGEEQGTDWISCDMCDCWVHFSCDKRPFLGTFKEYSRGRTRTYSCPRCYEIKRQRSLQQQHMQQAAAAAAAAAAAGAAPGGVPGAVGAAMGAAAGAGGPEAMKVEQPGPQQQQQQQQQQAQAVGAQRVAAPAAAAPAAPMPLPPQAAGMPGMPPPGVLPPPGMLPPGVFPPGALPGAMMGQMMAGGQPQPMPGLAQQAAQQQPVAAPAGGSAGGSAPDPMQH